MEGYIAQVRLFAANFAPRNWAYCQGQQISISQNTALFSLIGTTYGGNGIQTFALPNFASRTAVGTGTNYQLGQMGGTETTTLTAQNLPAHTHTISGTVITKSSSTGGAEEANGQVWGPGANNFSTAKGVTMNGGAITPSLVVGTAGGGAPINNLQPYLAMNYVICMYGIFPSRN